MDGAEAPALSAAPAVTEDGAEAPALSAAPAVTEDGAEAPSASPVVTEDGAEDEAPSAAPAATDEGAEDQPRHGDSVSEEQPHASAKDHADRVGVYCCQDCGEAFTEEASYSEHRHQHLQEKVILDEQFGFQNAEKDTAKNNFCTVCKTSFVDLSEFHSHMEQKHGVTSQDESHVQLKSETATHPKYECPECGRCYGMYGHFLNHVRAHTQASKSLFCDLEHLKKKSFQCESCGRSYSRASALDAHRRCHEEKLVKSKNRSSGDLFHTEEEPAVEAKPAEKQTDSTPGKLFNCSCGREFTALMGLKTHQRFCPNNPCTPELTVVKPKKIGGGHRCSECGKTYSSHIALINHERWHSKIANDPDRKYSCEACGKVFVSLTFYEKHQHRVHNAEAPAKSFLHQVCQLQKKAFECNKCGLKFSRASALQSHLIHHTENFQETLGVVRNPRRENTLDSERNDNKGKDTETMEIGLEQMETNSIFPARIPDSSIEHVVLANETDEDAEIYKPEDLIVQVISGSESEEELAQEPNPDLELLCESDQEQKDDYATGADSSRTFPKSEMDLNIVQIDYEQADAHGVPVERDNEVCTAQDRYDCPDCYRWFTSAVSLRVHRNWHNVRTRRQQTQDQPDSLTCSDCGQEFADQEVFKNHLHQHALEEEEDMEVEEEAEEEENLDTSDDKGDDKANSDSLEGFRAPTVSKKRGRKKVKVHACDICGKVYKYFSSFKKHEETHHKDSPGPSDVENFSGHRYECGDCGMGFIRKARLLHHMRNHRSSVELTSEYLRCDQCNKSFSSEKAWMTHYELHELKPFWCLSCSKGFYTEELLEKHLQSHIQKTHSCNICNKSFRLQAELAHHYNTHSGAKPFECKICGKAFSHPGYLVTHSKKHHRANAGSIEGLVGVKKPAVEEGNLENKAETRPPIVIKEEMDTDVDEPSVEENCVDESREIKQFVSQALGSVGSDGHSGNRLETAKLDNMMSQDIVLSKEYDFWEWECCVCDMGFDEVGQLHSHYIKHATGELPIPHDGL